MLQSLLVGNLINKLWERNSFVICLSFLLFLQFSSKAQETAFDSLLVNYEETGFGDIGNFSVSDDGKYLCVSGQKRSAYVIDILSQKTIFPFELGFKSEVSDISFSPNDSIIAITGGSNFLQIRSMYTGKTILSDRLSRYMTVPRYHDEKDIEKSFDWYMKTYSAYMKENRYLYGLTNCTGSIFRSNEIFEYYTPFEIYRFSLSDNAPAQIDSSYLSSRMELRKEPPIKHYSVAPAPWILKWMHSGDIKNICYSSDYNYCACSVKDSVTQKSFIEIWDVKNRALVKKIPTKTSVKIIFLRNDGKLAGYTTNDEFAEKVSIINTDAGTSKQVFLADLAGYDPDYYFDQDNSRLFICYKSYRDELKNDNQDEFLFNSLQKGNLFPTSSGNTDSAKVLYSIDTTGLVNTYFINEKTSPDKIIANKRGIYLQSGQSIDVLNSKNSQLNNIYNVSTSNAINYIDVQGDSLFVGTPVNYRLFNLRTMKHIKFIRLSSTGSLNRNANTAIYFQDTLGFYTQFARNYKIGKLKIPEGKVRTLVPDPTNQTIYFTSIKDSVFNAKTYTGLKAIDKTTKKISYLNYTPSGEFRNAKGLIEKLTAGKSENDDYAMNYKRSQEIRKTTTKYFVNNFNISPDGQLMAAYINGVTSYEKIGELISDLFKIAKDTASESTFTYLIFLKRLEMLMKEFIPGELKLWKKSPKGWTELPPLTYFEGIYKNTPQPLKFSKDSKLLLAMNPNDQSELQVWQLDSMKLKIVLSGLEDDLSITGKIDKSIAVSIAEFSDNNRYVAVAYESNNIEIHDLLNPSVFVYPPAPKITTASKITSLKFIRNDTFLLAGMQNGSFEMINLKDKGTYVKMYLGSAEKDYYIPTGNKYYACGKAAYKKITFSLVGKTYPVKQFDFVLHRPDILASHMNKVFHNGYEDYIAGLEQVSKFDSLVKKRFQTSYNPKAHLYPPLIEILNSDDLLKNQFTTDKQIIFKLRVNGIDKDISKVHARINGSPLYGIQGLQIKTRDTIISLTVPLGNGKNKIDLFCINEAGTESLRESMVTYSKQHLEHTKMGKLYLVAFAIDKYEGTLQDMHKSTSDALALQQTFKGSGNAKLYKDIIIKNYFNRAVSKENIVKLKNELLATMQPEDNLLILWQGHASTRETDGKYYFATSKPNKDVYANAIPADLIEWLVDSIPTRNKLMIMNTCQSGNFDKNQKYTHQQSLFEEMENTFEDISDNTGTFVISATSAVLGIHEDALSKKCTPLIGFILKGLTGNNADDDKDGKITITELLNFVQNEAQYEKGNNLQPSFKQNNIDNDFIISAR